MPNYSWGDLQFCELQYNQSMRQERDQNQSQSKNNLELQSITAKEWGSKIKDEEPDSIKMHVYNFLITEGHFDIARTFAQEASIPALKLQQQNDIYDEENTCSRLEIKNLIRSNKIDEAIQMLQSFEGLRKGKRYEEIMFDLRCLKVVNLIKDGELQLAIESAQLQLIPLVQRQPSRMETLEKVMSIIAFVNLQEAKNQNLASNNHKLKLADQVNTFLLGDSNAESIKNIISIGKWLQKRLDNYIYFPHLHPLSQQLFQP